ncbi:hypothetical protein IJG72_03645 [bacterium]|nr:hypothetical protein [bacterium]
MIKRILLTILIISIFAPKLFAATQNINNEVQVAIQKYKAGNYVGCIQDLDEYLQKNTSNQLGNYYLAMAYTKIGDREKAVQFYNKTKALNPNNTLGEYAQKGLVCIEDPSNCYNRIKETAPKENLTELDVFVRSNYGNGLSSELTQQINRSHVERLRKEMNTEQELNRYEFKDYKNFSKKKGSHDVTNEKIATSKPTDAEIVKALKVLNDAGLNNIAKQYENNVNNTSDSNGNNNAAMAKNNTETISQEEYQKQLQQEYIQAQMALMSQPDINSLFGDTNNQNNSMNNNMVNMLPYLMMQQGQSGQQQVPPEMLQTMMMNSMIPNLNFNTESK